MKYFKPRCQKWATFKTHKKGGRRDFPSRLRRWLCLAATPQGTQAKTNKFCFLASHWFSECDHLFICKINLLTIYLGRVHNREYHGQQQAAHAQQVLLDSCSRFNVLNFPRSQRWNKYQKGSGSRVLVFLQEFWNPSYSSVMVRSQKIEATTHNFL